MPDLAPLQAWLDAALTSQDRAFALEFDGDDTPRGRPWDAPPALLSAEVEGSTLRLTQAWRGQRSLLEIAGITHICTDTRPHSSASLRLEGDLELRRRTLDPPRGWLRRRRAWDWTARTARAWILRP